MLMMRPNACSPHRVGYSARTKEDASDVDIHHLPPFRQRDLVERPLLQGREDGRVVDQHVDAAQAVDDGVDHRRDRGSSATSTLTARPGPACVSISSATASAFVEIRSATTATDPAAANWRASSRPMPWPAPVMTTTRSFDAEVPRRGRYAGVMGGVSQRCRRHSRSSRARNCCALARPRHPGGRLTQPPLSRTRQLAGYQRRQN